MGKLVPDVGDTVKWDCPVYARYTDNGPKFWHSPRCGHTAVIKEIPLRLNCRADDSRIPLPLSYDRIAVIMFEDDFETEVFLGSLTVLKLPPGS